MVFGGIVQRIAYETFDHVFDLGSCDTGAGDGAALIDGLDCPGRSRDRGTHDAPFHQSGHDSLRLCRAHAQP